MSTASTEVLVFALIPALLWGLAPIFDKRGMAAGGDAVQASLVVVVVELGCYLLAIALLYGFGGFAGLTLEVVAIFVFAGAIGTALGRIAIFVGVDRVGASINSAILSSRPLFATLIAIPWLGEGVDAVTATGIVVIVFGLTLLATARGGDLEGWTMRDLVWPIAAALTFAVANVARRYGLLEGSITALEAVTINELAGFVVLVGYAVARGQVSTFRRLPRESYGYFAVSGLLTTVAMLSLMIALGLEAGRIAIVDPLVATAPLVTLVFAAVFLRDLERVTRGVLVGATLVVIGAVLITV